MLNCLTEFQQEFIFKTSEKKQLYTVLIRGIIIVSSGFYRVSTLSAHIPEYSKIAGRVKYRSEISHSHLSLYFLRMAGLPTQKDFVHHSSMKCLYPGSTFTSPPIQIAKSF